MEETVTDQHAPLGCYEDPNDLEASPNASIFAVCHAILAEVSLLDRSLFLMSLSFAALFGAAGCWLDVSAKHNCRVDSDCLRGRLCISHLCSNPVAPDTRTLADAADLAHGADNEDGLGAALDGDTSPESAADGSLAAEDADAPSSDTGVDTRIADRPGADAISILPDDFNYIFLTASLFSSKGLTLESADGLCNQSAAAAGVPGIYRAWLSTTTVNARDRLAGARGWIRPDGAPFVDTVENLVAGRIFYPPRVNEFGHLTPLGNVITGTLASGDPIDTCCHDWTDSVGSTLSGSVEGTTQYWTGLSGFPCGSLGQLYCFGTTHAKPVAPTPTAGRLAFVTNGVFKPAGGIAAADELCAKEAKDVSLTGTFLAFLSTSTATAASRFSAISDPVWVRLDGVPLVELGDSLLKATQLVAPLNVTSTKLYLGNRVVFTGSPTPEGPTSVDDTCLDWQSSNPSSVGRAGNVSYMPWWWTDGNLIRCASDGHIYCLQL